MKLGLAVLPLEVWADFLSPWFTRQELAQILNGTRNRGFASKLDKLLHGCGKPTLRYLTLQKTKTFFRTRASLIVSSRAHPEYGLVKCAFPKTQMPENIRGFKWLSISFLDDQVLDFLVKLKPLFNNVVLDINWITPNVCTLFGLLFPMIAGIRGIKCNKHCFYFLERQFPGTLERPKELHLPDAETFFIPEYVKWLCAPQHSVQHEPRFFKTSADVKTITAIVEAVRKQFLAATIPATFIIFLDLWAERHDRVLDEFTIKNATTNEKLTVQNAIFETQGFYGTMKIHYVQIVRHPIGADAKIRGWIEQRAYYEKRYNTSNYEDKAEQMISINGRSLTIGHISKNNKACAIAQSCDQPADDVAEDEVGPSTSANEMKK